jgi:hypothetical protein
LSSKYVEKNRNCFEEKRKSSNFRKQELKEKILQLQKQMQINQNEQESL